MELVLAFWAMCRIQESAKPEPAYHISCRWVERGADGREHVATQPQLITIGGQPAHVQVGGQTRVELPSGRIEAVPLGRSLRLTVGRRPEKRVRLDLSMEHTEPFDSTYQNDLGCFGKSIRVVETVPLDVPRQFVLRRDGQGTALSWVEVTVREFVPRAEKGGVGATFSFGVRMAR